ncbi:hypothetical protein O3G_MSEX010566 [Manduca sexta]|uniref:Uncharacterized protein n=1 Tax=Manduca sexta TaxID=7130 RepID=A0A921ZI60_MANSE|nr:hypothetical protein O3G_MSEX010566 [Manduca sexta]
MKFFLLAVFVATAFAVPIPLEDDDDGAVEFIVNGVAKGEPLELGDVLGIHVNEHVDGVLAASTNLLHPLTAVGIAEAAAAAADVIASPAIVDESDVIPEPVVLPAPAAPEVVDPSPEVVIPESVVLPAPGIPEVVLPESVVLPAPAKPEIVSPVVPEGVVLPSPAQPEVISPVVPEPVVLPAPSQPEVISPVVPEPVVLPAPSEPEVVDAPVAAPHSPSGEVFNNGVVQVSVNTPQEAGVFSTLQSWMSFVLNYFSGDAQTSHQII